MSRSLKSRINAWWLVVAVFLLSFGVVSYLTVPPVFKRVDASLAPVQDVLMEIAGREERLLAAMDTLDQQMVRASRAQLSDTVDLQRLSRGGESPVAPAVAQRSLANRYVRELDQQTSVALAEIEERIALFEATIDEAWAALDLGDFGGAVVLLHEIEGYRDEVQRLEHRILTLAFTAGVDARANLRQAVRRVTVVGVLWLMAVLALAFVVSQDISRHVLVPVSELEAGVDRIALGDWSRNVPETGTQEFVSLAKHFNAMAELLRRRAGRHAQLTTAGELLTGAAHELNNPLQVIRGQADLRRRAGPEEEMRAWQDVFVATQRAARLVQQLVRFVRESPTATHDLDLNQVVEDALDMIAFQFAADGIEMERELAASLPAVTADPNDLTQVVVNLLGNAHSTLLLHSGERRVRVVSWSEDNRVFVRVRDSGPGVPPLLHRQIFAPFYTTRSEGLGLGLAVSRDLVRRLGGDLVLDQTAEGASFTMSLPAVLDRPAALAPAATSKVGSGSLRGKHILVVDDEEAIRNVLHRFLEREGAKPLTAAGGVEAVELIRQGGFDAILLDLRMPDLDGSSVYDTIVAEQPSLAERTIILSGDLSRLRTNVAAAPKHVLTKPVELSDLRQTVIEVLNRGNTQQEA